MDSYFIDLNFHKRGKFSLVDFCQLKKQHITILATQQYLNYLTILSSVEKLINATMADNIQEHIDPNLFGEFMKKVTVWDFASITRDSYLVVFHDEKEKLTRSYYFDMKSKGCQKF